MTAGTVGAEPQHHHHGSAQQQHSGMAIDINTSRNSSSTDKSGDDWRTSTNSTHRGDFVLGQALSGRAGTTVAPGAKATDPDEDLAERKAMRAMSMVWSVTCGSLVFYAIGCIFFVSSAYFNRQALTGFKAALLDTSDGYVHSSGRMVDLVFFLLFLSTPVFVAATLYEVVSRHHEGSLLRARQPLLQWARPTFQFNMTRGEVLFLCVVTVANLGVFLAALLRQHQRAMSGFDLDVLAPTPDTPLTDAQRSANAIKGVANAFGYCALLSIGWIVLLLARPASDFVLTDVFALSHASGRVYATRLAIWVGVAIALHLVLYLKPYADESVLGKRLVFAFTGSDSDSGGDLMREARDEFLGWSIFFGELSLLALVVVAAVTAMGAAIRDKQPVVYQCVRVVGGILALACLHVHYDGTIAWLFPWLCLLIVRTVHAQANRHRPVEVIDFAPLRNGMTRLVVAASLFLDHSALPGKFALVSLPSVCREQWHALYMGSSTTATQSSVTLYITARGRWSEGIRQHAALCRQKKSLPLVFLDGFYGNQSMDRVLAASFVLLVAVGDVHAAYALSLFQELMTLRASHCQPSGLRKVTLVWHADNLCFMKEMEPMLRALQRLDPHGDMFSVQLFLSRPPSAEDREMFPDRTPLAMFATTQFAANRLQKLGPTHAFYRALHSTRMYLVASKLVVAILLALMLFISGSSTQGSSMWVLVRMVEMVMVAVATGATFMLGFAEQRMVTSVMRDRGLMPAAHDVHSLEEQQRKVKRMVAGGFDVIGSYEYESGLGFMEEYGVRMSLTPPVYAQIVDQMCRAARKQDAGRLKDVCVEISAPSEVSGEIVADLRHASEAPNMHVHVEHLCE